MNYTWEIYKILASKGCEQISMEFDEDFKILEVKYKNGNYSDYEFDEDDEIEDSAFDENGKFIINNKPIPDFAFIGDYYVPKYLLEKYNISYDCRVKARVIYGEDKMKRPRWKVVEIEKYMPE